MRFEVVRGLRAVWMFGVCIAALLIAQSAVALADLIDDSVKELKDLEKAGDNAKCIAKLQELSSSTDARVLAAERDLAKSSHDMIARTAIRVGASHKDPKLLEWLRTKITDKDLFKDKSDHLDLYKCILEVLPVYRDPSILKPLEEVERAFLVSDGELSALAIKAYGSVPQKSVVDQMLDWLEQLEQSHGGKSAGGSGGKTKYAPEVQKARDTSRDTLLATLTTLTDQAPGDLDEWKKWWAQNSKTFVFPPPDAGDKDVDVSKLTKWTDKRYGYTIVKPESSGWVFKPADASFRIQLLKTDGNGVWQAQVGWSFINIGGSAYKEPQDYADWWIKQQLPNVEFASFSPGGEPIQERAKFGGRDWTVVSAKGVAKEGMASWGTMERRVYITKQGARFIYAWAVVRSTLPDADKQATWDIVEKATFPLK